MIRTVMKLRLVSGSDGSRWNGNQGSVRRLFVPRASNRHAPDAATTLG